MSQPSFIRYFCTKNNWDFQIPDSVMRALLHYDWPGNIRELLNILERMALSFESGTANSNQHWDEILRDLSDPFSDRTSFLFPSATPSSPSSPTLSSSPFEPNSYALRDPQTVQTLPSLHLSVRQQIQRETMLDGLKKANGNVSVAAKILGVPRSTFYKRMKRYGLDP